MNMVSAPVTPLSLTLISKTYFILWKTPGVFERMWSVNIEASISGKYRTLGGYSGSPSEKLGSLTKGIEVTTITDDWYMSTMGMIVISLGARRSAGENSGCTWECHQTNAGTQTNSERCLGSYRDSIGGLQVLSETIWMYMSNQLPSTANMMHGLLFIITSESY